MEIEKDTILHAVRQAQILLAFATFVEKVKKDSNLRVIIITLLSENKNAIKNIFRDRIGFDLNDDSESKYMYDLVTAYFRKDTRRTPKQISDINREELLKKQNCKCVFCGQTINASSPVDHIVPFVYVGDELKDNYQILCNSCNSRKNKQLTYQIQAILQGGLKGC